MNRLTKHDVLTDVENLRLNALAQVKAEHSELKGNALVAMEIYYALKAVENQLQTKAGSRYSLVWEAYTKAVFEGAGYNTIEEWLDACNMSPKSHPNFGQVFRIATVLTVFCVKNKVVVNGNQVNHDWFIDFTNGKCKVNRARHIIRRAKDIISITADAHRVDKITQLLEWVDDRNITNRELMDMAAGGDEGDGDNEDNDRAWIDAMVTNNGELFTVTITGIDADEYNHLKSKTHGVLNYIED